MPASFFLEQITTRHPLHALPQHRNIEVDQQAKRLLSQFQIGQQLCFVKASVLTF